MKTRHILLWLPVILITIVTGLYHWADMKTPFMHKLTGLVVYVGYFLWLWLSVHLVELSRRKRVFEDDFFIAQCKAILMIVFGNKIIPHIGSLLIIITGNERLPDAYKQSWITFFIVIFAILYLIYRYFKRNKNYGK